MRARLSFVLFLLLLTAPASFAKDVYLSIGGSANGFFTDARIFNPSYDKEITITARYLPAGNVDNQNVATKSITVGKRSMAIYDNVVQSLFGGGPALGAIRLTSDDDFIATQRIYADLSSQGRGTLGQFVPGLDASSAKTKGILVQLKSGQSAIGNFRTNWGGANPNATVANIRFELFDINNQLAGTNNLTLQPYGVFSPANIVGFFGNPNRDLSDAWIAFESDVPIFVYGSIVDNTSTDPTFVPASEDSGVRPPDPPPPPDPVTVNVFAQDFDFDVAPSRQIRAGDQVRFRLSKRDGPHGFRLGDPNGNIIFEVGLLPEGNPTERVVTLTAPGTYTFVCTNSGCGEGHFSMVGQLEVAP